MSRPLPTRALAIAGLGLGLYLTCLVPMVQAAAAAPTAPTPKAATEQKAGNLVDKSGTDTSVPGKEYNLTPKTGDSMLQPLVGRFANIIVGLAGSLALLIFVWAGISMVIADGDAKKIDTAKRMMIWTGVGLFVIFASEAIVRLVLGALMKGTVS
jgi:hypothetical protein